MKREDINELSDKYPELFAYIGDNFDDFEKFWEGDDNALSRLQFHLSKCKICEQKQTIYKGDSNYTFDGIFFENLETIGAFPPIINLKNAI